MKAHFLLVAIALTATLAAEDIKTNDGKLYKNATITAATAAYVTVSHDDGLARVFLENLPEELQKKYGYDPGKAAQHMTTEAQAQAQAAKQRQLANAMAEFDKASVFVTGSVSQVADGGVIFRGSAFRVNTTQTATRTRDGNTVTNTNTEEKYVGGTGLIFIVGSFNRSVDGDAWEGQIWPAGTYTYESVGAGTKTIERWATTREAAITLQLK